MARIKHSFDPLIATKTSVEKACILSTIEHWTVSNKEQKMYKTHNRKGFWWTWLSRKKIHERCPYLPLGSIGRWLIELENDGWVKSSIFTENLPTESLSDTKAYALTPQYWEVGVVQNEQGGVQNEQGGVQNEQGGVQNEQGGVQNEQLHIYTPFTNTFTNTDKNANAKKKSNFQNGNSEIENQIQIAIADLVEDRKKENHPLSAAPLKEKVFFADESELADAIVSELENNESWRNGIERTVEAICRIKYNHENRIAYATLFASEYYGKPEGSAISFKKSFSQKMSSWICRKIKEDATRDAITAKKESWVAQQSGETTKTAENQNKSLSNNHTDRRYTAEQWIEIVKNASKASESRYSDIEAKCTEMYRFSANDEARDLKFLIEKFSHATK